MDKEQAASLQDVRNGRTSNELKKKNLNERKEMQKKLN